MKAGGPPSFDPSNEGAPSFALFAKGGINQCWVAQAKLSISQIPKMLGCPIQARRWLEWDKLSLTLCPRDSSDSNNPRKLTL